MSKQKACNKRKETMRLFEVGAVNPCTFHLPSSLSKHLDTYCFTPPATTTSSSSSTLSHCSLSSPLPPMKTYSVKNQHHRIITHCSCSSLPTTRQEPAPKLGKRWMEYQGINNWAGLLDPLDDNLRNEILRYGHFVEAAYRSFDFDPSSPTYGSCKFSRDSLLTRSGCWDSGYTMTKNLRATSGLQLPQWMDRAPSWVSAQSSWIGYVAVCQDREEINRLGRRDVVIAFRGTATCMEWFENLRATLTSLPHHHHLRNDNAALEGRRRQPSSSSSSVAPSPMVESGFLSLYTSGSATSPSLQKMVREEVARIFEMYGDEPLSFTITGHSLGAALATLTAYDIKSSAAAIASKSMVTVISFGGPRVGNKSFRSQLEKSGARILRIVNSDDLITKVPGLVIDDDSCSRAASSAAAAASVGGLPGWLMRRVEGTQWAYADVGQELRLNNKASPLLSNKWDVATCHELSTYLHLVGGFKRTGPRKVLRSRHSRQYRLGLTARS